MREEGYYWVKSDGEWIVAQWFRHQTVFYWLLPGWDHDFEDDHFEEIDEKRLTHEP